MVLNKDLNARGISKEIFEGQWERIMGSFRPSSRSLQSSGICVSTDKKLRAGDGKKRTIARWKKGRVEYKKARINNSLSSLHCKYKMLDKNMHEYVLIKHCSLIQIYLNYNTCNAERDGKNNIF